MDRGPAIALTIAAGAFISFQPPANSQLGKRVGDIGAAFTSLLIATLLLGIAMLVAGKLSEWTGGISEIRPQHVLGAVSGAIIVTVSLVAVRTLGVGTLTAGLVVAQLISAVIIDRLGLLGLDKTPINDMRWIGMALLVAGTYFMTAS